MMQLSDVLKKLRIENNLTQTDLANQFGITKVAISKYENNKNTPSDNILKKYSDYFSISLRELSFLKNEHNFQQKFGNSDSLQPDYIDHNQNIIEFKAINKNHELCVEIPYFEGLSAGLECSLIENQERQTITTLLKRGSFSSPKNLIACRINGESMSKILVDHSIAIIDKGSNIKSGDIIAYQLGSNEYGLKRIYDYPEYIKLCPESYNPIFQEKILLKETLIDEHFIVIGKLIKNTLDDKTLKY